MGGFTAIYLRDNDPINVITQNIILKKHKVPEKYRFYSEEDIRKEYAYFLLEDGVFPERQFPRDKIRCLEDFKRYWSTEALGECFVPPIGTLTFDCYFGRTSQGAMRSIALYLAHNHQEIKKVSGSWGTFIERCGVNKDAKFDLTHNIIER